MHLLLYLLLWHGSNALIVFVLVQDRAPLLSLLAISQKHCLDHSSNCC